MYQIGFYTILTLSIIFKKCVSDTPISRSQPEVEIPILLDSYLPASMQVIAHLTDLMKYDVKPVLTSSTTTTVRPTPHHRPGVYSPSNPLGPAVFFAKGASYEDYVQRLKNPGKYDYFDRYRYPVERSSFKPSGQGTLPQDIDLLGLSMTDLLKQISKIEDYDFIDDDDKIQRFSENYEDPELRQYIVGGKKPPPTKAYVTLLSLYDLLNKESKKLQLNKYGGYTTAVLKVLAESSKGTSLHQLHVVLGKLIEHGDTRDPQILSKVRSLVTDAEEPNGYLIKALLYIPPLQFQM